MDGRTFEKGKKWPPVHAKQKNDLGIRVQSIDWQVADGAMWLMRSTPLEKSGRVVTCQLGIPSACVEGAIAPAEHERIVAERAKNEAAVLAKLSIEQVPGYSEKFRILLTTERRQFMVGAPWPQFFGDPKREVFFKGTVRAAHRVAHEDRGLYYEIVGDPAPGTPMHEKGLLLLCELPFSFVDWVESSWEAADLDKVVELRQAPEAEDARTAEGDPPPPEQDFPEGTEPSNLLDD